ncbi:MAG: YjjG family noncanonical pyrimidine nucleotidase [Bacteroidota bacterium]|nr:YjjG family noncanonical pyrimidine nucleotidase [Bacteroidota bacterium]MDP4205460.1 YjjG family noncanonical pyrimidine nucleotidase [Bacteroidota bacterium]
MAQYKNLFFDLDNTLWDFTANAYEALKQTFMELEIMPQIGNFDEYYEVYTRINNSYWEQYRRNEIKKEFLSTRRFEDSFKEYGVQIPVTGQQTHDRFMQIMPSKNKLTEGTIETLDKLFPKHRMFIITNGFKEVQYNKLKTAGLSQYFKRIFTSEEIKVPKPSKEIFDYAVKSVNARKRESLMIGDSWEVDILGAMNAGIDQVYYCPSGIHSNKFESTGKARTYIIQYIPELLNYI